MTPEELAILKVEIQTDPLTYGYAAHVTAAEPEIVAELLNKLRDGTDGEAAITIRRADVEAREIIEAIDVRDFVASPNPLAVAWFESATQLPVVRLANPDGTKSITRRNIDRAVNDTNGSQTRLDAIAIRLGSRAEQILGADRTVSITDVADALRS